MKFISRISIVVPTFILIFVLYSVLNKQSLHNNSAIQVPQDIETESTEAQQSVLTIPQVLTSNQGGLDLTGPVVCKQKIEDSEYENTAHVQNGQARIVFHTKNEESLTLLTNDCVYKWQQGSKKGTVTCGVQTMLAMYNTVSSIGILDHFSGQLSQMIGIPTESLNQLLKTCKKENFEGISFEVPNSVVFEESSPAQLQEGLGILNQLQLPLDDAE